MHGIHLTQPSVNQVGLPHGPVLGKQQGTSQALVRTGACRSWCSLCASSTIFARSADHQAPPLPCTTTTPVLAAGMTGSLLSTMQQGTGLHPQTASELMLGDSLLSTCLQLQLSRSQSLRVLSRAADTTWFELPGRKLTAVTLSITQTECQAQLWQRKQQVLQLSIALECARTGLHTWLHGHSAGGLRSLDLAGRRRQTSAQQRRTARHRYSNPQGADCTCEVKPAEMPDSELSRCGAAVAVGSSLACAAADYPTIPRTKGHNQGLPVGGCRDEHGHLSAAAVPAHTAQQASCYCCSKKPSSAVSCAAGSQCAGLTSDQEPDRSAGAVSAGLDLVHAPATNVPGPPAEALYRCA